MALNSSKEIKNSKNSEEQIETNDNQKENISSESDEGQETKKIENSKESEEKIEINENEKENILLKSDKGQETKKIENTKESEEKIESNESNKENTLPKSDEGQETKKPKKSIWVITSIIVLGLLGGAIYLNQTNQVVETSTIKVQDYSSLLDSWNEQVQNNTDENKFLLSRDSNEKVIHQLNEWMKNFYISEATDSVEYNQFLESNKLEKLVTFNTEMSEDEISEKLKILSKEKTISSIVKKVLMMNDIEFWKKNKKH